MRATGSGRFSYSASRAEARVSFSDLPVIGRGILRVDLGGSGVRRRYEKMLRFIWLEGGIVVTSLRRLQSASSSCSMIETC